MNTSPERCNLSRHDKADGTEQVGSEQLRKTPRHIVENLASWVDDVEIQGLEEAGKVPGYHDEPLHGERQGQRSIRLSRSYRAIYVVKSQGAVEFVSIEEITQHAY